MYTHRKDGLFTFSETCVEPAVTIYCGCLSVPGELTAASQDLVAAYTLISLNFYFSSAMRYAIICLCAALDLVGLRFDAAPVEEDAEVVCFVGLDDHPCILSSNCQSSTTNHM